MEDLVAYCDQVLKECGFPDVIWDHILADMAKIVNDWEVPCINGCGRMADISGDYFRSKKCIQCLLADERDQGVKYRQRRKMRKMDGELDGR